MTERHYLKGELYLSLEAVAQVYSVRTVWLREVFDTGLLGEGLAAGRTTCIAAAQMDRVAAIVRLHVVLGLEVDAIALLLEAAEA